MNEMITVSRKEYDQLIEDSIFLEHLHANGVDNWEGYSRPDDESEDDDYYESQDSEFDEDDIPF